MHFHRGKGICQNSWRKSMRCPRRLRVPSLNKIAQAAVRPYLPLWEFSRSELFPGLNRCIAEWKSPPYGCRLGPIGWNTNTRRSVSKGRIMLVPFAPLGCKRIRSASLRWWSFQNLRWSQVLTSVPNRISPKLSFRYDKWFSLRNEYDHPFEMRICTCVIKPFGSLQVVIRFSEWQAAGSRIRQAWDYESRCQNCPFDMINDCHFEMIYDSLFESRAVSIGRQSDRNGSETQSESRD